MATTMIPTTVNSASGPKVLRGRNGRFVKVDGVSNQLHRRYCDNGSFVTDDGRSYEMVAVTKVLLNGKWTVKF